MRGASRRAPVAPRGARGAPRSIKRPAGPARAAQPIQPIGAIGAPKNIGSYNSFIRGAARNGGMLKGQPTPSKGPKGFPRAKRGFAKRIGPPKIGKQLEGSPMRGGANFAPRRGRMM